MSVSGFGYSDLPGSGGGGGVTQLTGDVTAGPGSGSQVATIANDAVTNAKAANMVQSTIKGRAAGAGTGDPTDLTPAQTITVLAEPFSAGVGILNPTGALTIMRWRAPFACTVTNVRGYRSGGTGTTLNARKNGASNHLASDLSLTVDVTWTDGGSVQNTAYSAGDTLELMLVSIAGTPTQVVIQVDFVRA